MADTTTCVHCNGTGKSGPSGWCGPCNGTGKVVSSLGAVGQTAAWEDKDVVQDSSTKKGMTGGGK